MFRLGVLVRVRVGVLGGGPGHTMLTCLSSSTVRAVANNCNSDSGST